MIKEKSIPDRIIEILEKESRLTINEMFERSDLPKAKKGYFRLCVNRLKNAKNPKIAKDGKRGREYLYSLKKNAITKGDIIEGFMGYNELFKKLTQTEINRENLKKIAKETINFNKAKKIEEMIEKNGILG